MKKKECEKHFATFLQGYPSKIGNVTQNFLKILIYEYFSFWTKVFSSSLKSSCSGILGEGLKLQNEKSYTFLLQKHLYIFFKNLQKTDVYVC